MWSAVRRDHAARWRSPSVNVVRRFDAGRAPALRAFLEEAGFRIEARPSALFFAARPGVSLTAYASGKLLITGAQAEEYAGVLAGKGWTDAGPSRPATAAGAPLPTPRVGADESGKGDYFGPLCVAAVLLPDAGTARLLEEKGVRDSKRVSDAAVGPLAALVRMRCPHEVRALAPPRYNDVYERFGSLNPLLATMHAEAIESLLAREGARPVHVDQFADPSVLERQLGPLARSAGVTQSVRGESDLAVAAASILARAEFLAGLAALEVAHGLKLPKGAGAPTLAAAKVVARKGGAGLLRQVAKLHFVTTRQALE